jgi:hypothetical protein
VADLPDDRKRTTLGPAQAMRLLAELKDLDQKTRLKRQPLSLQQKQRRQQIAVDLHRWALARQREGWSGGGDQRRDPRANVRLRVQLIGGPRPIDLESDSIAVGGLSLQLNYQPHLGDHLALRLVPPPPDEPVEVEGEVIWFNAARQRAGIQFHAVSDEARALLERIVFSDLLR